MTEEAKITAAAEKLAELIMAATDEELEELDDYVNDGFSISINIEFDDDKIDEIDVEIGHFDRMEWHGMSYDIDTLRRDSDALLARLVEHIEIAAGNHRDALAA